MAKDWRQKRQRRSTFELNLVVFWFDFQVRKYRSSGSNLGADKDFFFYGKIIIQNNRFLSVAFGFLIMCEMWTVEIE